MIDREAIDPKIRAASGVVPHIRDIDMVTIAADRFPVHIGRIAQGHLLQHVTVLFRDAVKSMIVPAVQDDPSLRSDTQDATYLIQ